MKSALKTAQNKTFRFEARTPNGKWFVCGRNVSAVEADAYAKKYLNDPNFRVVPAQLPFDATTIGRSSSATIGIFQVGFQEGSSQ